MGLAISRRVVGDLELRHLALSDLEFYTPNVQSSTPALGDRANWSIKVQVGRIFGAAPHLHRQRFLLSEHPRLLHALLLIRRSLLSRLLLMAASRLLHALLFILRDSCCTRHCSYGDPLCARYCSSASWWRARCICCLCCAAPGSHSHYPSASPTSAEKRPEVVRGLHPRHSARQPHLDRPVGL